MTFIEPKEFKLSIPPKGCLPIIGFFLTALPSIFLFYQILSIFNIKNTPFEFVVFFATMIPCIYAGQYLINAQSLISVDTQGMSINITKAGISYPRSETFYKWSDIAKFDHYSVKGGTYTVLYFTNGNDITFYDTNSVLGDFLIAYFPEKERKY